MSTVCYCGQPDCPVTTWEHDACVANLRAERDALRALTKDLHTLREAALKEATALRGRIAELDAELARGVEACRARVCLGAQEAKAERDELAATLRGRAEKVEAARALCRDQLDHGQVEADDLAGRILDAMDAAAKK